MTISFDSTSNLIFSFTSPGVPFDLTDLSAYSILAADIDGDTDIDVVTASVGATDGLVAFHENSGDGTFQIPIAISSEGNSNGASSLSGIDFTNDGIADTVAYVAQGDNTVAFSGFSPPSDDFLGVQIVASEINAPNAIVTADINGDGEEDLVAAAQLGNQIFWYENNGNFTIGDGSPSGGGTPIAGEDEIIDPSSIFAADFDGNGSIDIAFASTANGGSIGYAANNGDGTNFTLQEISTEPLSPTSIFGADVDGDNDTDLIVASTGDNRVLVYENDGAGNFAATGEEIGISAEVYSVFAADLEGDGDIDIVSASYGNGEIAVYENLGDGEFEAPEVIGNAAGALAVFAADLDGDTDLEVIASSFTDQEVVFFEQTTELEPAVSFLAPTFSVEENVLLGQVVLTRTGDDLSAESVVAFNITGGTATAGEDFDTTFIPTSVTFAPDETSQTVDVTIIDDLDTEGTEDITFSIASTTNAIIGNQSSAALNISDDDLDPAIPTVDFAQATFNAQENLSPGSVVIVRSGDDLSAESVVALNVTGGTATADLDFEATSIPTSVTFAPDETSQTIDVDIIDDLDTEGTEDITFSIASTTNAAIGDQVTTTLEIADDDDDATIPNIAFDQPAFSVGENLSPGQLVITRTGDDISAESVVTLSVTGGSATAGDDFDETSIPATVTFAPDETSQTIDVAIIDDLDFEGTESITFELTADTNSEVGETSTATLSILDDELPPLEEDLQLTSDNTFLIGGDGTPINLELSVNSINADFINEIGVYRVEPGQSTRDILEAGEVIFSATSNSVNSSRILTNFTSGEEIGFYLVANSTTDAVLVGQTSLNSVIVGSSTTLAITGQESSFTINFEDSDDGDFNDLSVDLNVTSAAPPLGTNVQAEVELIDLLSLENTQVQATINATEEGDFNNVGGLYTVLDAQGTVFDPESGDFLTPEDAGYTQAAINNSVAEFTALEPVSLTLFGGFLYAPYTLANGDSDQFYTSFLEANPDGLDHVILTGDNSFSFEDQLGLGDADFNDFSFDVMLEVTAPSLA